MTFGAAGFELGLPLLIALLYPRLPPLRSKLVVLLGALSPAVLIYVCLIAEHLAAADDLGGRWAFYAVWEISFFPYLAALIAGLAVSFASQPRTLIARYAMGFICALLAVIALLMLAKMAPGA